MEQIDDLSHELKDLVLAALEARKKAYAPYSKIQVGAAVRSESGFVFSGCNIENTSYAATLCAEQVAVSMAVAAGAHSLRAGCRLSRTIIPLRYLSAGAQRTRTQHCVGHGKPDGVGTADIYAGTFPFTF